MLRDCANHKFDFDAKDYAGDVDVEEFGLQLDVSGTSTHVRYTEVRNKHVKTH